MALFLTSCGGGGTSDESPPVQVPSTPTAESSAQFVNRISSLPVINEINDGQAKITFSGCLRKNKTEDPRTVGAASFLTNLSGFEYRLVDFSYVMNTSGIRSGETVETDVGFTVLPRDQLVALNSGEELLITHRYDTAPSDPGVSTVAIPKGGLAIQHNQKLSVGSVSAIFPLDGSGARTIEDSRLADGSLFRVCFAATLMRADLVSSDKVVSYRSPFRDRSYVADLARTTAPYTNFKNVSSKPVQVHGITSFISNLSSTEQSAHSVDVLVNGKSVTSIALPSHIPGQSLTSLPLIHPVSVTLAPGDILSVRGRVFPRRAIVFDYAAFIFADDGLVHVDERLDMLPADLNGDGYDDIIDHDAAGSLWVSLRVGQGLQNTQQEWARAISSIDSLTRLNQLNANEPVLLEARNKDGLCLRLTSVPARAKFLLQYCQNLDLTPNEADVWGDFDGDRFIDRMRIDVARKALLVSLGSATGLREETIWQGGYGAVDRMFVSDANADGRSDVVAEWSDASGFRCVIFYGEPGRFREGECPK